MNENFICSIDSVNNEIVDTNFFNTNYNYQGYCYLIHFEDCFHLLVSTEQEDQIAEMKTGKFAILTVGYHIERKGIWSKSCLRTSLLLHLAFICPYFK